jgi:D-glycero-D-manno-heptose 1,7-bisphosphate phosphatase
MGKNKAVFFDRDGTINVEKNFLIDPLEFEFIAGVPEALKRLQEAGFLLVVVTNQSGIARGYFSLRQVNRLHDHMRRLLAGYGVGISAIYVCPHHPAFAAGDSGGECECRKGKPGMLLQAARDLDIDLRKSYMIGDKKADIEAGLAAGCQSFLVKTGYGEVWAELPGAEQVTIVADLPQAEALIISRSAAGSGTEL